MIWMFFVDVVKIGVFDNDWVEVYNCNGMVDVWVIVSYWILEGMVFMYYGQECIVNILLIECLGKCGGIYNFLICILLKFSYFIGGYVQFSYVFNYYGFIGN